MIDKVRGRRIVIVVPLFSSVLMSISPLISEILRFTTFIPTPLPDTFVTFLAVENPGINSKSKISLSFSSTSLSIKPFAIAASLILFRSIPFPSSEI